VATTNVDGAYRIGDVTPGRATVLARAKGYADSRQDVTVDGKNTLDFTLGLGSSPDGTKMATLSGFVGTPSSTSLPGVLVSVTSGDAAGQTATTGSDGRYTFRELPTGPTSLAASAPDFVDANSSVTVGLGNLNFMMRRTPGSISETMTGTISTSEAGCLGDGDPDDSPCRRYPFEVTNSGPLTATLTWQTGGWFDLAVLQRGQPVAWGTPPSMTPQVISKNLTAGIYEIWVSYKSSGTENFVLNVARPK
jgi:hypothetical protein